MERWRQTLPQHALYLFIAVLSLIVSCRIGSCPFDPFAPFLVSLLPSTSLFALSLNAIMAGLITDAFTSTTRFGSSALITLATVSLLYTRRYLLIEERMWFLPTMSALFGLTTMAIDTLLHIVLGLPFVFIESLTLMLVIRPLIDAIYAMVAFSLPLRLYRRLIQRVRS